MTMIKRVVYCGWRGIDYLCVETDKPLNAFLGENGAGKSTLAIALIYALLPDRKILNVRPISDIKDASVERQDSLMGRIDPELGFAYVAMDIVTRTGKRLIAGIYLAINNQRLHITQFSIPGLPSELNVSVFFNCSDEEKVYTPDLGEFKRNLARAGHDCKGYDNLGDYCKLLHDAGILPTPMYTKEDRELFARLLETSFLGGISPEIAKNLKHYLLQEAKHIPETVRRMHECTEDVLKTQRAVDDAKRQIRLVQAAFVTGRDLVCNAIAFIDKQFGVHWASLSQVRADAISAKSSLAYAQAAKLRQADEMDQIRESERSLKVASQEKVDQWEAERDAQYQKKTIALAELADADQLCLEVEEGRKAWIIAAEGYTDLDFDRVEAQLDAELDTLRAGRAKYNEDIRRHRLSLAALERTESDGKVVGLAGALGATTLENALADIGEAEARDYEAALHGMVNGVVGASLKELEQLQPGVDLPDRFWMGERAPEAAVMVPVGRWNVTPSLGGYTVLSDAYKASFGHEARARRVKEIELELLGIETRAIKECDIPAAAVLVRQRCLAANAKTIRRYLLELGFEGRLECEVRSHREQVGHHAAEIRRIERRMRAERDELAEKIDRFSQQRESLSVANARLDSSITASRTTLAACARSRAALVESIMARIADMRACKTFLHSYRFFNRLEPSLDLTDPAAYVAIQAKSYTALAKALEGESPSRLEPIATLDINHHAPADCLAIWPVLMDILHDHVPSSMLELDGENLLGQMELRRDNLLHELVKKQNDVKIKAREIAMSINTQISIQKRQVNALSAIGSGLRFGKVEGIRITLVPKVRMIELLQKASDDAGLFSDDGRSMDAVLADYFKEALGERMQSSDVLDYRTFIDLKLEAKRLGRNDWVPAFSLSGGEAIGAGIAIVLMLFRALASRGDYVAEHLTPVFIMDEINRIDPRGQRMVVDLCELNGIQLFVTGPEMVPASNTRMYMLARSMDPVERVITRELRGFAS